MTHNEKHPGVPASLYLAGLNSENRPQGYGTVAPGASVETGPLKIVDLSANQRALLDRQFQLIAERLGELDALKKQVSDAVEGNMTRSKLIADLSDRVAQLESRGPRCQKCGQYKNEPGICWTFETPSGYPEPNGEHEWK